MTMPFTSLWLLSWKYCDLVVKRVWKKMTPLQEKKEALPFLIFCEGSKPHKVAEG